MSYIFLVKIYLVQLSFSVLESVPYTKHWINFLLLNIKQLFSEISCFVRINNSQSAVSFIKSSSAFPHHTPSWQEFFGSTFLFLGQFQTFSTSLLFIVLQPRMDVVFQAIKGASNVLITPRQSSWTWTASLGHSHCGLTQKLMISWNTWMIPLNIYPIHALTPISINYSLTFNNYLSISWGFPPVTGAPQ